MKKWIAFSMASAMLLTMSTAAFADIATGVVSEEKPGWPNEFGFGGQIKVMREEEVLSYDLEENNKIDLQPGDDLYIPLYYTTAEGESVTIGASKEEMTGHVPYTGSIDKNWKINFIDKSKTIIESTDFYRAESKDSGLVKGALYIKAQTADSYNSLTDLEFNFGIYVSERYSQNKTEQIQIEGVFANPKADNLVDFDWENNVYEKAVWEVAEDQDGTATFNFNDDAYYTVRMFGGDKVMLDFDRTYDKAIADRYIEDLYFYNFRGELDEFSATGTLTIPVEQEMFMYQIVNGALKATDAVYSEAMEAKRLLDVLDKQLAQHKFVAGDEYTIADMAIWPWFGNVVLGGVYDAAEFLDAGSYKHVQRWAKEVGERPAVKRGRIVNRTNGPLNEQLHERHDASDFETNTEDKRQG